MTSPARVARPASHRLAAGGRLDAGWPSYPTSARHPWAPTCPTAPAAGGEIVGGASPLPAEGARAAIAAGWPGEALGGATPPASTARTRRAVQTPRRRLAHRGHPITSDLECAGSGHVQPAAGAGDLLPLVLPERPLAVEDAAERAIAAAEDPQQHRGVQVGNDHGDGHDKSAGRRAGRGGEPRERGDLRDGDDERDRVVLDESPGERLAALGVRCDLAVDLRWLPDRLRSLGAVRIGRRLPGVQPLDEVDNEGRDPNRGGDDDGLVLDAQASLPSCRVGTATLVALPSPTARAAGSGSFRRDAQPGRSPGLHVQRAASSTSQAVPPSASTDARNVAYRQPSATPSRLSTAYVHVTSAARGLTIQHPSQPPESVWFAGIAQPRSASMNSAPAPDVPAILRYQSVNQSSFPYGIRSTVADCTATVSPRSSGANRTPTPPVLAAPSSRPAVPRVGRMNRHAVESSNASPVNLSHPRPAGPIAAGRYTQ